MAKTLLAVAFLAVCVACRSAGDTPLADGSAAANAGSGPPPGESGELTFNPLVNTSWIVTRGIPIVDGHPVTFSFDVTTAGGFDGCNAFGTTYRVASSTIEFSHEIESDSAGCPTEAVAVASSRLRDRLRNATDFELVAGELVLLGPSDELSGKAGELRLRPERVGDEAAIVGQTWMIRSVVTDGVASSAVGEAGFLRLNPDWSIEGSTGCRSIEGDWTHAGVPRSYVATFSVAGSCVVSELVDQHNHLSGVLRDRFTAEVVDGQLVVSSSGDRGATYDRAADFNPLAGTSWIVVDGIPVVEGAEARISFAENRASGSDGCNGFGIDGYVVSDATIVFSERWSSTLVGCSADVNESSQLFKRRLGNATSFKLSPDGLILSDDTGKQDTDLRLVPDR